MNSRSDLAQLNLWEEGYTLEKAYYIEVDIENMDSTMNNLIISCHYALLGAIPYKLRGLAVKLENETLYWKGYFNGEPTDDEKEMLSVACTEVLADFPHIKDCEEEYINHKFPLKMDKLQFWAFLRWEDNEHDEIGCKTLYYNLLRSLV